MCGRFTLHHTTDQVAMRFDVQQIAAPVEERYNIAPTQSIAAVVQEKEGRTLEALHWGLIPSWAKEPQIGNKMINARAETLAEKPAYKPALMRRRCLIPCDGFYEWKQEGNIKQPMYIQRQDGELFALAGLWEEWRGPEGAPLRSCTIITVAPNTVVAPIHNRMPAVLRPDQEEQWLDPQLHDIPHLMELLQPYPASEMRAFPVSKRVNTPGLDDPGCVLPLAS